MQADEKEQEDILRKQQAAKRAGNARIMQEQLMVIKRGAGGATLPSGANLLGPS